MKYFHFEFFEYLFSCLINELPLARKLKNGKLHSIKEIEIEDKFNGFWDWGRSYTSYVAGSG